MTANNNNNLSATESIIQPTGFAKDVLDLITTERLVENRKLGGGGGGAPAGGGDAGVDEGNRFVMCAAIRHYKSNVRHTVSGLMQTLEQPQKAAVLDYSRPLKYQTMDGVHGGEGPYQGGRGENIQFLGPNLSKEQLARLDYVMETLVVEESMGLIFEQATASQGIEPVNQPKYQQQHRSSNAGSDRPPNIADAEPALVYVFQGALVIVNDLILSDHERRLVLERRNVLEAKGIHVRQLHRGSSTTALGGRAGGVSGGSGQTSSTAPWVQRIVQCTVIDYASLVKAQGQRPLGLLTKGLDVHWILPSKAGGYSPASAIFFLLHWRWNMLSERIMFTLQSYFQRQFDEEKQQELETSHELKSRMATGDQWAGYVVRERSAVNNIHSKSAVTWEMEERQAAAMRDQGLGIDRNGRPFEINSISPKATLLSAAYPGATSAGPLQSASPPRVKQVQASQDTRRGGTGSFPLNTKSLLSFIQFAQDTVELSTYVGLTTIVNLEGLEGPVTPVVQKTASKAVRDFAGVETVNQRLIVAALTIETIVGKKAVGAAAKPQLLLKASQATLISTDNLFSFIATVVDTTTNSNKPAAPAGGNRRSPDRSRARSPQGRAQRLAQQQASMAQGEDSLTKTLQIKGTLQRTQQSAVALDLCGILSFQVTREEYSAQTEPIQRVVRDAFLLAHSRALGGEKVPAHLLALLPRSGVAWIRCLYMTTTGALEKVSFAVSTEVPDAAEQVQQLEDTWLRYCAASLRLDSSLEELRAVHRFHRALDPTGDGHVRLDRFSSVFGLALANPVLCESIYQGFVGMPQAAPRVIPDGRPKTESSFRIVHFLTTLQATATLMMGQQRSRAEFLYKCLDPKGQGSISHQDLHNYAAIFHPGKPDQPGGLDTTPLWTSFPSHPTQWIPANEFVDYAMRHNGPTQQRLRGLGFLPTNRPSLGRSWAQAVLPGSGAWSACVRAMVSLSIMSHFSAVSFGDLGPQYHGQTPEEGDSERKSVHPNATRQSHPQYRFQRVFDLTSGRVVGEGHDLNMLVPPPDVSDQCVVELCPEVTASVRQMAGVTYQDINSSLGIAGFSHNMGAGMFAGVHTATVPMTYGDYRTSQWSNELMFDTSAGTGGHSVGGRHKNTATSSTKKKQKPTVFESHDGKFILRFLEEGAMRGLLNSLPRYHHHVTERHTSSILPRYVALFGMTMRQVVPGSGRGGKPPQQLRMITYATVMLNPVPNPSTCKLLEPVDGVVYVHGKISQQYMSTNNTGQQQHQQEQGQSHIPTGSSAQESLKKEMQERRVPMLDIPNSSRESLLRTVKMDVDFLANQYHHGYSMGVALVFDREDDDLTQKKTTLIQQRVNPLGNDSKSELWSASHSQGAGSLLVRQELSAKSDLLSYGNTTGNRAGGLQVLADNSNDGMMADLQGGETAEARHGVNMAGNNIFLPKHTASILAEEGGLQVLSPGQRQQQPPCTSVGASPFVQEVASAKRWVPKPKKQDEQRAKTAGGGGGGTNQYRQNFWTCASCGTKNQRVTNWNSELRPCKVCYGNEETEHPEDIVSRAPVSGMIAGAGVRERTHRAGQVGLPLPNEYEEEVKVDAFLRLAGAKDLASPYYSGAIDLTCPGNAVVGATLYPSGPSFSPEFHLEPDAAANSSINKYADQRSKESTGVARCVFFLTDSHHNVLDSLADNWSETNTTTGSDESGSHSTKATTGRRQVAAHLAGEYSQTFLMNFMEFVGDDFL